jgi:hypothetical protein
MERKGAARVRRRGGIRRGETEGFIFEHFSGLEDKFRQNEVKMRGIYI